MEVKGVREIAVLSRTQRLVVRRGAVSVINAGPVGPPGIRGPNGIQGPQGIGAVPLSIFQYAPSVVDAATIFTTWWNVAGIVAFPAVLIPASGRLKCTVWGYLKGGPSAGVVYFMLCDYSTGVTKFGPTVAVPIAAGERKTFCTAILVQGLTPGDTTPSLTVQVMASVAGITWRSYDPGGTRNPDVAPNLVNEGGPTVVQLEVA